MTKQDDRIIDPDQEIWIAGHNDPGYSPDPDSVVAFATQDAARSYVADEIERLADGLDADAYTIDEPDELADSARADAENVRGNADQDFSDEFSIQVEDGRSLPTVFWVQRSTLGERYAEVDGKLDLESLDWDEEFRSLLDELPQIGEVYVTATSATPVYDAENDVVDLQERSGWLDANWSRIYLHEKMEDVRPLWRGTDPAEAAEAIKNYIGAIEPSCDSRGSRGTYYGSDSEESSDATFSYAAHIWGWDEAKVRELDGYVSSAEEKEISPEMLAFLQAANERAGLQATPDSREQLQARLQVLQQNVHSRAQGL